MYATECLLVISTAIICKAVNRSVKQSNSFRVYVMINVDLQDLNGPENGEMPQVMNEFSCTAEFYRGQSCREALLARQSCLDNPNASNSPGEVYIPLRGDQDVREQLASQLLLGLQSSPANSLSQCQQTVVVPFLCSFLFGLCNSNGELYLPSSEECRVVTEDLCRSEFQLAMVLIASNADLQLPQCETLPDTSLDCSGKAISVAYSSVFFVIKGLYTKDVLNC